MTFLWSSWLGRRTWLALPLVIVATRWPIDVQAADPQERDNLWLRIEKFVQPPTEFAGKFGSFRSPLTFANRSTARTAEDWTRRRKEILDTWRRRLGEWPPLVERPAVTRLE